MNELEGSTTGEFINRTGGTLTHGPQERFAVGALIGCSYSRSFMTLVKRSSQPASQQVMQWSKLRYDNFPSISAWIPSSLNRASRPLIRMLECQPISCALFSTESCDGYDGLRNDLNNSQGLDISRIDTGESKPVLIWWERWPELWLKSLSTCFEWYSKHHVTRDPLNHSSPASIEEYSTAGSA